VENTSAISVSLRRLKSEDLNAVVKLHRSAFPDTANSKLGSEHLKRLYSAMLQDPDSTVLVAIKNSIVGGVVTATCDTEEFKKRFKAGLSLQGKCSLAIRMLFHPITLMELVKENHSERPVVFQNRIVKGCLTAIAVDSQCRQSGIGRTLVAAIEEFFKQSRHPSFYLFTRADNSVSRQFYKHLGFVELERRNKNIVLIRELH
jgi:ribosomal protein S18 acetylase RimI-like enzyme